VSRKKNARAFDNAFDLDQDLVETVWSIEADIIGWTGIGGEVRQ
jgi:hypothetical protein